MFEEFVEVVCGGAHVQGGAGSGVEFRGDLVEVFGGVHGQVAALGEARTAAAGWCSRCCRAARASGGRRSRSGSAGPAGCRRSRPARAAVPGDRAAQVLGQFDISRIIASATLSASWLAGQVQQDREPGGALHQGADRRAVAGAEDQVALPVPGHGPVGDLGGALADREGLPRRGCSGVRMPRALRAARRSDSFRYRSLRSAPRVCTYRAW